MATIIIIDDDKTVSQMLSDTLAVAGHECIVVNRGMRAFEALKGSRPDLVLVDLMMSEVSGFRLCRMIRSDPRLYAVPVIVLSDAEDEPEMAYCVELGADDYLAKPIVTEKLMGKVQSLLLLRDEMTSRDSLTGMLGMDGIRREINHRLARGTGIAACYIGVATPKAFGNAGGTTGVDMDELVREVAALIHRVAAESGIYELLAAYVGAAHFIVAVNLDEYERFCKKFVRRFDSELACRWKRGMPVRADHARCLAAPAKAKEHLTKVSIGVVHNKYKKYRCADAMFRAVAELQREATKSPTSCYLICKRRIAP